MSFFFSILLVVFFIAILIPLVFLIVYLFNHRNKDDLETGIMRQILFWTTLAKFLFFLAAGVLVAFGAFNVQLSILTSALVMEIPAFLLSLADWWALLKMRKLIQT